MNTDERTSDGSLKGISRRRMLKETGAAMAALGLGGTMGLCMLMTTMYNIVITQVGLGLATALQPTYVFACTCCLQGHSKTHVPTDVRSFPAG